MPGFAEYRLRKFIRKDNNKRGKEECEKLGRAFRMAISNLFDTILRD
jgi:hypothetical protein